MRRKRIPTNSIWNTREDSVNMGLPGFKTFLILTFASLAFSDTVYQEKLVPSFLYEFADTLENHTFTCTEGYELRGPYCYSVSSTPLSFEFASESCMGHYNYRLVEPSNVYDNIHLASLAEDNGISQFWIGLSTNSSTEGVWSDGRTASVSSASQWAADEPLFTRGQCVGVEVDASGSYGWKMFDCDSVLPYMCYGKAFESDLFRCEDNSADMPTYLVCDGVADCDDSSDEKSCGTCDEELTGTSGFITSDSPYVSKRRCSWAITGPLSTIIRVTLESMDTEYMLDVLNVYSGGLSEADGELIAMGSGYLGEPETVYSSNNLMYLTFITDSTIVGPGFNVSWEALSMTDLCQKTLTAYDIAFTMPETLAEINETDSLKGEFTTPFYPDEFIDYLDCEWTIQADDPNGFVTLQFNDIDVDDDTITVTDGTGLDDPVVAELTGKGSEATRVIISKSRSLVVRFSSSSHQEYKGFLAKYWQGCNGIVHNGAPGMIQSPGYYGESYPNNMDCSWILAPSEEDEIMFTYFKPSDVFHVDDSTDDTVNLIFGDINATLSGSQTPTGFSSLDYPIYYDESSSFIQVKFATDRAVTADGFRMYIAEGSDCVNADIPTAGGAGVNFTASGFLSEMGQFTFEGVSCVDERSSFFNEEYLGEDEITVTCKNGKYNINNRLRCSGFYCGMPPTIENGYFVDISGLISGDRVKYGCYPDHTMEGDENVECTADGWGAPPNCTVGGCPALDAFEDGNATLLNGDGTSVGTAWSFECDIGYQLYGSQRILCTQFGWSHPQPDCEEVMCIVPDVRYGRTNTNETVVTLGTSLSIICDDGYEPIHPGNETTCMEDMTFDSDLHCTDINECLVNNGSCEHECVNTRGDYYCECTEFFQLSPDNQSCEDIDECNTTGICDQTCTNVVGGYTCECEAGYTLYTANGTNGILLRAGFDGMAADDIIYVDHTCVPNPCSAIPATIGNGTVIVPRAPAFPQYLLGDNLYFPGERVDYHCDLGFVIGDNGVWSSITCQDDATWDTDFKDCEPAYCTEPFLNTGSEYTDQLPDVSDFVPVAYMEHDIRECDMGRPGILILNRTCIYSEAENSYKLYGDFDYCPVIDCGEPEVVPGGDYTVPDNTWYGSNFTFTCSALIDVEGASKAGDSVVRCQESGNWDFGSLTCLTTTCSDPGRPVDGYQNATSYEVGSLVYFGCDRDGFELTDANPLECFIDSDNTILFNGSHPDCIDTESPVFPMCVDPIEIELPRFMNGSSYDESLTQATDNSGLVSRYVTDPENFNPNGHVFTSSMNFTIQAFDGTGNSAACIVEFVVLDAYAPLLECEPFIVYLDNATHQVSVDLSYDLLKDSITVTDDTVSAEDLTWEIDPTSLVLSMADYPYGYEVLVSALDSYWNVGECVVNVVPMATPCSEHSLPVGFNATSACDFDGDEARCNVTCDYGFFGNFEETAISMLEFTCVDGDWVSSPAGYADAELFCVAPSNYADSWMSWTITYTWDTASGDLSVCARDVYVPAIEGVIDSVFATFEGFVTSGLSVTGTNYTVQGLDLVVIIYVEIDDDLTAKQYIDDVQDIIEPFFVASRTENIFFVQDITSLDAGSGCPAVTGYYNSLNWTHECTNETQEFRSDSDGYYQCVPCPPGSYYSSALGRCALCDVDTYQTDVGETSCVACPNGTNSGGMRGVYDEAECFIDCDYVSNGLTSSTGAYPCQLCPVGSVPTAADTCTQCAGSLASNSTVYPVLVANDFSACTAACAAGYWSATGYEPCDPLPLGYYSTIGVSVFGEAVECETYETTSSVGSTSQGDCLNSTICDNSPCLNGAVCVHVDHSYACSCADGFVGLLCDQEADPCDSAPCYNGGTCASFGGSVYECECLDGYNGTQCETEPDDCIDNDCLNGAMCQDGDGTFTCLCPSSGLFVGDKCNSTETICSAQPCASTGTCVPLSESRRECQCDAGYEREDCSFNTKECWARPCLHGGTCTDGVDSYTCACTPNYIGDNCEFRVDPCNTMDCADGECYDKFSYNMGQCLCSAFTETTECKLDYLGLDYMGKINTTVTGKTCQRWDVTSPQSHAVGASQLPDATLADAENYCRNPVSVHRDIYDGPWCFTTDGGTRWEYCDVPLCPGLGTTDPVPNIDCRVDETGWKYGGTVNTTKSDFECQRWDSQSPHTHTRQTQWRNFPEHSKDLSFAENYCRNPQKNGNFLFCYTLNDTVSIEACETDFCPSASLDDTCTPIDVCFLCEFGTCTPDADYGFTCACDAGYEGSNCATVINNCASDPCQNSGACTSLLGNYTCDCTEGWTGYDCDEIIDLCETECDRSHSDGCDPYLNDYECFCIDGWAGKDCDVAVNLCAANPCLNNATCVPGEGNYTCSCAEGWSGALCGTLLDLCDSAPCTGAAPCIPLVDDFYCVCPDGSFGKDCGAGQNVSLCDLGACRNGGNCTEVSSGDVTCDCAPGFTGAGCEIKMDLCNPDYGTCKNGGECEYVDYDEIECDCAEGYEGEFCETETDNCAIAIEAEDCASSATCYNYIGGYICSCPIGFIGYNCTKAIDGDFDLHFTLPDKSSTAMLSAPVDITDTPVMSIMLHMRYQFSDDTGTFASLCTGSSVESPDETKMIELTEGGVVMHLANGENVTMAYNFPINQDGEWHHLGLNYYNETRRVTLYYDTTYQQINLDDVLQQAGHWSTLVLGGDFIGYISQAYMWGRELMLATDILPADADCTASVDTTDLLAEWGKFTLGSGVNYVYPAKCESEAVITGDGTFSWFTIDGFQLDTEYAVDNLTDLTLAECKAVCQERLLSYQECASISYTSDDGTGLSVCLINSVTSEEAEFLAGTSSGGRRRKRSAVSWTYLDVSVTIGTIQARAGPVVTSCPDDIAVTSPDRTSFVTWTDPVFENARLVQSNYLPGSPFTWGVYQISYVAESASLKKAYCDFTVTISYWDCLTTYPEGVDPAVCYTSGDTGICDLTCSMANQTSCLPSPLVLTCSPAAGWDQSYPLLAASDACTDIQPRVIEIHGFLTYPITAQTTAVKTTLEQRVMQVFTTYEEMYPTFCAESGCTSVEIEIAYNAGENATVDFMLPASDGLLSNIYGNVSLTANDIVTKGLYTNDDFTFTPANSDASDISIPEGTVDVNSAVLEEMVSCKTGQALRNDGCVICCAGSYFNETEADCVPCPIGYYQEEAGQDSCLICPAGGTTELAGADDGDLCTDMCSAGEFYNNTAEQCQLCGYGYYQSEPGQYYCDPCGPGQTTETEGSTNDTVCFDECVSGTQLSAGGVCEDCPQGYYRTTSLQHVCVPCPMGFITPAPAAVASTECNIVDCQSGEYRNVTDNTCYTCPFDTYQPERWQEDCLPCNATYGTSDTGSDNEYDCQPACDPGYELDSVTHDCVPCEFGFYKNIRFGDCQPCPAGFLTPTNASTSTGDCSLIDCPAGEEDRNGTCRPCPVGSYRPAGSAPYCQSCPASMTTFASGSETMADCVDACDPGEYYDEGLSVCKSCPAGTYQDQIQATACLECPENTYNPSTGSSNSSACLECGERFITNGTGSQSQDECKYICEDGSEFDNVTDACIGCEVGYYRNATIDPLGPCMSCPIGFVTATGNSTSADECDVVFCTSGSYKTASDVCELCPFGTYQPQDQQSSCISCDAGDGTDPLGATSEGDCGSSCAEGYEGNTTDTCKPCDEGFFKSERGREECDPCPHGTFGELTGQANVSSCTLCPEGYTTNSSGSSDPAACLPGCSPGDFFVAENDTCVMCDFGFYQDQPFQDECLPCPNNTGTLSPGADSRSACLPSCPPGQEFTTECELCGFGFFKDIEGPQPCRPCPRGKLSEYMGAQSPDECTADNCPSGQEDDGSRCVPVDIGYYRDRDAGTGPYGILCPPEFITESTGSRSISDCNIANCSAGTFRNGSNQCEDCPVGSYQSDKWQDECEQCPPDSSTLDVGAESEDECFSTDECKLETDSCDENAHCINTVASYECACNTYYTGDGFTCIHECEAGYCKNGGTCEREPGTEAPGCVCLEPWRGLTCEERVQESDTQTIVIIASVVGGVVGFIFLIFIIIGCLALVRGESVTEAYKKALRRQSRRLRRQQKQLLSPPAVYGGTLSGKSIPLPPAFLPPTAAPLYDGGGTVRMPPQFAVEPPRAVFYDESNFAQPVMSEPVAMRYNPGVVPAYPEMGLYDVLPDGTLREAIPY